MLASPKFDTRLVAWSDYAPVREQCHAQIEANGSKVLQVVQRSDGYLFFLYVNKHRKLQVRAGCHDYWTIAQYRRHVGRAYNGLSPRKRAGKMKETLAILAMFEATAKAKWSNK
jgi:hypothetical protein